MLRRVREKDRKTIVGTCRVDNHAWIAERRLYNLPLPKGGTGAGYASVTHVVVYARDLPALAFAAKYVRDVDGDWLAAQGYRVSPKPHGARYALFELGGAVSEREALGPSADVFVCSARWTGRIDAAFFEGPLPECGGRSVPNVFERLRPFFGAWRSARAYNPVQMDFLAMLTPHRAVKGKAPRFIDLFCGVGGIRMGMEAQGFECVMSADINAECRRTYDENFNEVPLGDVTKIGVDEVPPHDILCAGFPCQPFSISGRKKGFADTRGTLFFEICRILEAKRPPVVFLENVKHLVHHDGGRTLATILEKLKELGYEVAWKVLNGVDFGVPQNRERIIIVGTKSGVFDFSRIKTVERRRLKDFLDTEGPFEYLHPDEYTLLDDAHEQPGSGLVFAGYRNKSIRKVGVRPNTLHLSRVHKQPNRIYSVNGVHPTLPSQESSGRYFILTEDNRVRKMTLNECWRIMGFPDSFKKVSSVGEQYRQLGNSVCVPMIKSVASEIKEQFFKGRFA